MKNTSAIIQDPHPDPSAEGIPGVIIPPITPWILSDLLPLNPIDTVFRAAAGFCSLNDEHLYCYQAIGVVVTATDAMATLDFPHFRPPTRFRWGTLPRRKVGQLQQGERGRPTCSWEATEVQVNA